VRKAQSERPYRSRKAVVEDVRKFPKKNCGNLGRAMKEQIK